MRVKNTRKFKGNLSGCLLMLSPTSIHAAHLCHAVSVSACAAVGFEQPIIFQHVANSSSHREFAATAIAPYDLRTYQSHERFTHKGFRNHQHYIQLRSQKMKLPWKGTAHSTRRQKCDVTCWLAMSSERALDINAVSERAIERSL